MNLSNVANITIPEGNVGCILCNNEIIWKVKEGYVTNDITTSALDSTEN